MATLGDGDTLMGLTALWTAAKYRLPVLFLVGNNRSYFNDELHQENVARRRGRNPSNAWVGQRLDDPAPDLAQLARGQGVEAAGPVRTRDDLDAALADAVAALRDGAALSRRRLDRPAPGTRDRREARDQGGAFMSPYGTPLVAPCTK